MIRALYKADSRVRALHPYFLKATSGDGFTVLLPMVGTAASWRKGQTRQLLPVGGGQFDYHDPIVVKTGTRRAFPADFWQQLLDHIGRAFGHALDEVELPQIRSEYATSGPLWSSSESAPYLLLDPYDDMSSLMSARTKKFRSNVNRRLRNLRQQGEVAYRTSRDVPGDEVKGWIRRLGASRSARYPDSNFPAAFFETLLTEATGPSGPAHFSALTVDGKDIAWHAGFMTKTAAFRYIPGFDDRFSDFSPGKLHLYFALDEAIRRNLSVFDFLRGAKTYKLEWTDGAEFEMFGCRRTSSTPQSVARRTTARVVWKVRNIRRRRAQMLP